MLNVFLSQSPLGWDLSFQLGSSGGVLGFLGAPLACVALAGVAACCLAAMAHGNDPPQYDRRGRMCRRGSRFWVVPLVICAIVFASRGFKDHVHSTIVIDPDDRATVVRTESLEDAVSRLERQLDHAGNQMDRAIDHTGTQIDTKIDRGAAQMVQHLERLAAQIERRLGIIKRQSSRRHRVTARPVEIAQAPDDPIVVEPSPPALPVLGLIPPDDPAPATPPAVPSASPTPAPAALGPVAQTSSASSSASVPSATAPKSTEKPSLASSADTAASADSVGEKLPEWTKTEIIDEGNRKLLVVPGGFAGSEKEAENDALEAARTVIGKAIQQADPKVGDWLPSAEAVREDAVRHTFVEKIHRKTVSTGTPFIVYRAYHQVELSPTVFNQLVSNWRNEVLPGRLEALGGIVALLTLTFATGAAYFRLDERTHGRYRGRLKLAAVAIISAGVAVAGALAGSLV
ncbi:MAG TPA: hypothetical protein VGP76_16135 [Planctomycetaceae bacterium]|nr:hypothetical protein [Planctomycetaceae bacterium]